MPAPLTRINKSRGPILGSTISRNTSGCPGLSKRMAFMFASHRVRSKSENKQRHRLARQFKSQGGASVAEANRFVGLQTGQLSGFFQLGILLRGGLRRRAHPFPGGK